MVWGLIGWESGASFFNQSESVVKQKRWKHSITFETHLKTALTVIDYYFQLYTLLIMMEALVWQFLCTCKTIVATCKSVWTNHRVCSFLGLGQHCWIQRFWTTLHVPGKRIQHCKLLTLRTEEKLNQHHSVGWPNAFNIVFELCWTVLNGKVEPA